MNNGNIKPANTKTKRKGHRLSKTAWKPGQSGNPKGAPKRGQSWKEIIKEVGELTPAEADAMCHRIAAQIASIGSGVTLKQAVILRTYAALLFEPDARLLSVIVDRDEGKVTQSIAIEDQKLALLNQIRESGLTREQIENDPILSTIARYVGLDLAGAFFQQPASVADDISAAGK